MRTIGVNDQATLKDCRVGSVVVNDRKVVAIQLGDDPPSALSLDTAHKFAIAILDAIARIIEESN